MLVILLLASVAVFYSLRFAPGTRAGWCVSPLALEQVRAAYRERLGLNRPTAVQYGVYLANLGRGGRRSVAGDGNADRGAAADIRVE
jgi:peptide/nickel transport system permease protein